MKQRAMHSSPLEPRIRLWTPFKCILVLQLSVIVLFVEQSASAVITGSGNAKQNDADNSHVIKLNQETIGSGSSLPAMESEISRNEESSKVQKVDKRSIPFPSMKHLENGLVDKQYNYYHPNQEDFDLESVKNLCQKLISMALNNGKHEFDPILDEWDTISSENNKEANNKTNRTTAAGSAAVNEDYQFVEHTDPSTPNQLNDFEEWCLRTVSDLSVQLEQSRDDSVPANKRNKDDFWFQQNDYDNSWESDQLSKKYDFLFGNEGIRFRKRDEKERNRQILLYLPAEIAKVRSMTSPKWSNSIESLLKRTNSKVIVLSSAGANPVHKATRFYRQVRLLSPLKGAMSWHKHKPVDTIRLKKNPFEKEGIRFKRSARYSSLNEDTKFKKSLFIDEGIRYKKSPFDEEGIRFKKSPFDEEGIRFKKSPFDEEGIRFKKSPFDSEGIRY